MIGILFFYVLGSGEASFNVTSQGFILNTVKYSGIRNTDYFSVVFSTINHNGILLYCVGDENYLLLELYHGYIGQVRKEPYIGYIGSGLADNDPHQIEIYREPNSLMLVLDRSKSTQLASWPVINPTELDFKINRIYVAGYFHTSLIDHMKSLSQTGLQGCIEEAVWNNVNLLYQSYQNSTISYCDLETFNPISFIEKGSFITLNRNDQAMGLTLVFDLMVYLNFSTIFYNSDGYSVLNISIVDGSFFMSLEFGDVDYINAFLPMIKVNNGEWHRFLIQLPGKNSLESPIVVFGVDNEIVASRSSFTYDTKRDLRFGGYNFVGCIKNLMVDGSKYHLFASTERKGVSQNGCHIPDQCVPNPCQHSGFCTLGSDTFKCSCPKNYPGDVCEDALYYFTCSNMFNCDVRNAGKQFLDVDGVGPLDPVPVICDNMEATNELNVVTTVNNLLPGGVVTLNVEPTTVTIPYALTPEELRLLTLNSYYCSQEVTYQCSYSRITDENSTLLFWTGGDGMVHEYWNSYQEYGVCECYIEGRRCDNGHRCNCNSNDRISRTDSVTFIEKNHLPIMSITAIDISSSIGKSATIRVGPLYCSGIGGRINAVTFQEIFSYLAIDSVNFANPGTIFFIFKTDRAQGNVMIFTQGRPNDEYYVIELTSPNSITTYFSMRRKKHSIKVELKPPFALLNNLEFHSLYFKITAKQAYLIVDGVMNSIPIEYDFSAPVQVNKDNTPFFVGGSPYNQFSGYRGIIRLLRINGVFIDLSQLANEADLKSAGVYSGVLSACLSSPNVCNFGECVDHFNYYVCDCGISPFYGKNCENEVSLFFESPTLSTASYYFTIEKKLTAFYISIAFRTEKQGLLYLLQGEDQDLFILMDVYPYKIRLVMNLYQARTKVADTYNFYIKPPLVSFTNGRPQIVQLFFKEDQFAVAINGFNHIVSKGLQDLQNLDMKNPRWVYLGEAPPIKNFPDIKAEKFLGCLGGLKVKMEYGKNDAEVIDIIKSIGGANTKNAQVSISTGICIQNITAKPPAKLIPTPANMIPGAQAFPIAGISVSSSGMLSVGSSWSPVIVAVLILIGFMLIFGIILFLRWYSRNYGIYYTHEGALLDQTTDYGTSKSKGGNVALPQVASQEVEGWYL